MTAPATAPRPRRSMRTTLTVGTIASAMMLVAAWYGHFRIAFLLAVIAIATVIAVIRHLVELSEKHDAEI